MAHAVSRTPTGYTYPTLYEVGHMHSESQINVFGVVTEWSAPKPTKNDLLCTVKITDPSLVQTASGTVSTQDVLVFAPDRAQLPQVAKPGDIIRFHRVKVNYYNGRVQVVCSLGGLRKYGAPASMCLFNSTPTPGADDENQPYQRSSTSYHFDVKEKAIITALRAFVSSGRWNIGHQDVEKYRKRIREIITATVNKVVFADLIGLVMAVETSDKAGEEKVVWMWDATDNPPYSTKISTNVNQGQPEMDPEARAAAALHPRCFPVSTLPPSVAKDIPMIGTAVPIVIRGNVVELPATGTWAKFRNCGFQIAQGQLQGVFAQKSNYIPWHEDESVLVEYTNRLSLKVISEWYKPGQSLCGSTTSQINREVTSLRQIAVDAVQPDAPPMKYRCTVRVLSYIPTQNETLCVPARAAWDAARSDGYTNESEWLFALKLRVVDGSGTELDVGIFGQDGVEFFKEIVSPQDLRTDVTAQNKLIATLNYLTGNLEGSNPPSQPVWLDMCIKSYFVEISEEERKKQEEEGDTISNTRSVRYRIFDTKLLNVS